MAAWLAVEDARGIRPDAEVTAALVVAVRTSAHIAVSPLARAQETAAAALAAAAVAGTPPAVVTLPDLREAPLPVLGPGRIRLPLDAWDVVCRTAWLAGWSGGVEPRSLVTARARRAAAELDRLSADGPVTVVAHGFFNVVLARGLRRLGWTGPRLPSHAHGAVTPYHR
jgi:broad specificity phosphatase PhoE